MIKPVKGTLNLVLRWLETVSSTYVFMGRYIHSLSRDVTIMASKNYPTIGDKTYLTVSKTYLTADNGLIGKESQQNSL